MMSATPVFPCSTSLYAITRANESNARESWSFSAPYEEVAGGAVSPQGDVWTWSAADLNSGLIVSYFVGDRSPGIVATLMLDAQARAGPDAQLVTERIRRVSAEDAEAHFLQSRNP